MKKRKNFALISLSLLPILTLASCSGAEESSSSSSTSEISSQDSTAGLIVTIAVRTSKRNTTTIPNTRKKIRLLRI